MSDEFGTVSARRMREIDVLRKHRESLVKMLADVDAQLRDLESGVESPAARPLLTTPGYEEPAPAQPGSGPRVLLIVGAALLALALIAWLIWRASSDRPAATGTVVEETTSTNDAATTTAPVTIAEAQPAPVPADALIVTPRSQDYGLVRKGTRATRQYQFTNNSEEPVTIELSRSACRCLYYEYEGLVPPKARESITVTVDGAKAKAGTLRETVNITTKADPTVSTTFDVIATIR